jgi:hypothetical protein
MCFGSIENLASLEVEQAHQAWAEPHKEQIFLLTCMGRQQYRKDEENQILRDGAFS